MSDTLMRHKLLLGTNFLHTVEINMKGGEIHICSLQEISSNSEINLPEIFSIDTTCEQESDNLAMSHVPDVKCRETLINLVNNYKPCKTREVGVMMKLIVKDDESVYQSPRRLSQSEKEEINKQIEQWLAEGIVQPSLSEYASPVVLVRKKNGSFRLCVDYRLLNKKIVKDRYPLPLIEDQLDLLQGAKVFSTLDLKNGFFHVQMDEHSRKYTAFIVPNGHFEFLRVPFGLCNSPAIFQKFINSL